MSFVIIMSISPLHSISRDFWRSGIHKQCKKQADVIETKKKPFFVFPFFLLSSLNMPNRVDFIISPSAADRRLAGKMRQSRFSRSQNSHIHTYPCTYLKKAPDGGGRAKNSVQDTAIFTRNERGKYDRERESSVIIRLLNLNY